jgi:hypothetical protein
MCLGIAQGCRWCLGWKEEENEEKEKKKKKSLVLLRALL